MQFETNQTGKKLHLITLFNQQCLYFDRIYSWLLFPLELFIFIYKGSSLYYTTFGGEIVFVIILFLVNYLRLYMGNSGNKGWSLGKLIGFMVLSLLEIAAFVFFLAFQSYTLYLEIGIFALATLFAGLEVLLCIPTIIVYQMNS